jgi:phosphatidylserine decarboxylase
MNRSKWPARAVLPFAQPGLKYIIVLILVTGMLFYAGWNIAAWLLLVVTVFVCWFFRDPDRQAPDDANALVSPADGRVIIVEKQAKGQYLEEPCVKVSIFMNVFNVHVNRVPYDGVVQRVLYNPGRFVNASFDKASVHNERNALIIRTSDGLKYAVVQIAGLIARRIVNCAREGEFLKKADRYGMIQFGSRLDLYLPPDFKTVVKVGDRTKAGSTIIGYMK